MKFRNLVLIASLVISTNAMAEEMGDMEQGLQNGKIEAAMTESMQQMIKKMKSQVEEMSAIQTTIADSAKNNSGKIAAIGQLLNVSEQILKEAQASSDFTFVETAAKELSNIHKEALRLK